MKFIYRLYDIKLSKNDRSMYFEKEELDGPYSVHWEKRLANLISQCSHSHN